MGSWNETCGVTQLPIRYTDPVVLFLLTKIPGESASGHCYSNDVWSPRSIQIYGKYNDYGTIEKFDENNWNIKHTVEMLKKDAIPLEMGENQFHDLPVVPEKFSFDGILNLIDKNRLSIKGQIPGLDNKYPNLPIGFMMVHQFIFDHLSSFPYDSWKGQITLDRLIDEGYKWVDELKNQAKDPTLDKLYRDLRPGMIVNGLRHSRKTIFQELGSFDNVYVAIGISDYMEIIADSCFGYRNDVSIDEMIVELAKFQLFNINFSNMRKTYAPQSGKGGQDQEYEIYKSLFEVSLNHINKCITDDE